MKIIRGVGERLPRWAVAEVRPVLSFAGAGHALVAGSCVLAGRAWAALSERLGMWERLGALAFTGYAAVYGCAHAPAAAPFMVPAALIAWCAAAWCVAPPQTAAGEAPPAPADQPPAAAQHAFRQWLLDLIGDQPGIHLRELYPAMRQLPGHEDRSTTELRAALAALNIPVTRSLRLPHAAGRSGVARADLAPLPSPSGESSGEPDGDAGQSTDSPPLSAAGEPLESA